MKKYYLKYIVSSIGILLVLVSIVDAQRSSGSRSSSFSSSSSSRPASTSSHSAPSTTSRSGGVTGSSYGSRPLPRMPNASTNDGFAYYPGDRSRQDAADKAQAQRQAVTGSSAPTRSVATQQYRDRQDVQAFRQQYGSRYQTRFTAAPAVRPAYIPTSYNNFNIVFDAGHGGYGYYNNGLWVHYDPFDDPAMAPVLMQQQGYVYRDSSSQRLGLLLCFAVIISGTIILVLFLRRI